MINELIFFHDLKVVATVVVATKVVATEVVATKVVATKVVATKVVATEAAAIKGLTRRNVLHALLIVLAIFIDTNKTFAQNYPEMIPVEGGSFTMGDMWEMNIPDELPRHTVTVSSFNMAKTETTVAQWKVYCDANGYSMPAPPPWGWSDTMPIVNVSWSDAIAYCNWLSNKTGQVYRLPTEAEWEYAAKGGSHGDKFKFGGFPSLNISGWYSLNSNGHPHTVAGKKPNELGLYDMCGNVAEWCSDWFDPKYYSISPSHNPAGPETGVLHIARGGCWYFTANYCTVAYRYGVDPTINSFLIGFRVVSTATPK